MTTIRVCTVQNFLPSNKDVPKRGILKLKLLTHSLHVTHSSGVVKRWHNSFTSLSGIKGIQKTSPCSRYSDITKDKACRVTKESSHCSMEKK